MMDPLTFIIELIKILAWPVTVLIIFLLLRRQIEQLFPSLQRFSYGGLELDFSRQVQELSQRARVALPAPETNSSLDATRLRLIDLAPISPRAAVLEGWLQVERVAVEAAKRHNLNLPSNVARSPLLLGQALEDSGIISDNTTAIYHRLRNLRNIAAHANDFSINPDLAIEYVDLAMRLTEYLQKA